MESPILWQILLQLILIMLNAVFACAEIAVISMNDNKLIQMAAKGDKRAVRLARLTSQPARFLATIQVAITLSGFLGSAFAADNFSGKLVDIFIGLGIALPVATLDTVAVIIITLVLSYLTLVFGELVPKRIAMKKAESLALGMSAMISFIAKLFAPLVFALTMSTNCILRLCGIDPNDNESDVSEEEIRMMVDVGSEKGVIDIEEKEMIQNVFEFNDITVNELATHRRDIDILWLEESTDKWAETIHKSRHSLYPLCDGSVDNIIGILNAKDYFRLDDKSRDFLMTHAVRPAYFVPKGICANILFRKMQQSCNHFAVVLDEYGGTVGIVTMNDLLEQLVGSLENDETAVTQSLDIESYGCNSWKIRGSTPLDDVEKILPISLPVDSFETFSGFVFGIYGAIPKDDTVFEVDYRSLHIQVTNIKGHRVEMATVSQMTSQ